MNFEYMRLDQVITEGARKLIDAASATDEFGAKAEFNRMNHEGLHTQDILSRIVGRAVSQLERRNTFFEVTLIEAMGNHIDYLLKLGPEKVSSEHIAGAMGLMQAVEEMFRRYDAEF
jgi:hypothetical protein